MKAIIRKELRENIALATIGLLAFAILTLGTWRYFLGVMDEIIRDPGIARDNTYWLQPLAGDAFLGQSATLCGVFGALLGWMQIFRERHRDLWAFLVHRPVNRTTLFVGKASAGLLIYSAVVGVPLLLFVLWAATPGHVAAPFEWSMTTPVLERFLAGMAAYFAGMLTGLRQARWYGSRGLGLGLGALVVFWALYGLWLAMAFGGVILALAAWGSFLGGGGYRSQPAWGRVATTLTMGVGSFVVMAIVLLLLTLAFFRTPWSSRSWAYFMTKDGAIYREEYRQNARGEIVDLEGKPPMNSATGQPLTPEEIDRQRSQEFFVDVNFEKRKPRVYSPDANDYYNFHDSTKSSLWYFWKKTGRLTGFDVGTRKLIGSIGPEGFATTATGNGTRFGNFYGSYNRSVAQISFALVGTDTGVFEAQADSRGLYEVFKTTTDDPVGGVGHQYLGGRSLLMVVTRKTINLIRPNNRPGTQKDWTLPYQPGYPDYNRIQISLMEKPERFAVWIEPNAWGNSPLKRHVTWLTEDGSVAKAADLPPLPATITENGVSDTVNGVLSPPIITLAVPLLEHRPWPSGISISMLKTGLIGGAICAVLGWLLARRHSFSLAAQLRWAVFNLLCGPPGLIAFICVQEWPASVECSNCHKQRAVDRESCDHCGARFEPPASTGVEIFEPLKAG